MRFVLASASPRRRELLQAAGFEFDVAAADIDETRHDQEPARDYVLRVAGAKAAAIAALTPDRAVLGADTSVVIEGDVLGKPVDPEDAARMLRLLSGRIHEVLTGIALIWQGRVFTDLVSTRVHMSRLSDAEIAWYVASGEPSDKAGAYAIQGLAARFIPRIDGSYSNVVGLPVAAVTDLFRRAGASALLGVS